MAAWVNYSTVHAVQQGISGEEICPRVELIYCGCTEIDANAHGLFSRHTGRPWKRKTYTVLVVNWVTMHLGRCVVHGGKLTIGPYYAVLQSRLWMEYSGGMGECGGRRGNWQLGR